MRAPPKTKLTPSTPARRAHRGRLASRLVGVGILQLCLLVVTAAVIFVVEGPHDQARPAERLDHAMIARLEANIDRPAELAAVLGELRAHRIEASLYDGDRQLVASNIEPPLAIPQRRRWPGDRPDSPPHDGSGTLIDDDHAPAPPTPTTMPTTGSAGSADPHAAPPPPPPSSSGSGDHWDRGDRWDHGDRGDHGDHGLPPDGFPHVMVIGVDVHGHHGRLVARGMQGAPPGFLGPLLTILCGVVIFGLGALLTARWIVQPIERLSRTAHALGAGDLAARSGLRRGDEIGELGEVVDDMADRLGTLMLAERELLANVAHELRTPLARIGVALDLAGEGDAAAARASLGEIAVDVSELSTILDDILTASRFELADANQAASFALRIAPTEPATLAAAAAERFRVRHPARTFTLDVAPGLPVIDVDPMLLRRVVDNLLENAHKYSPDAATPIQLVARLVDGNVELRVIDRGIGIPAEDLPRVFTAFFRGDRSRSRETGGVGLGLTLARRIVVAHGGTIAVASEPNQGTTVCVSIPPAAT